MTIEELKRLVEVTVRNDTKTDHKVFVMMIAIEYARDLGRLSEIESGRSRNADLEAKILGMVTPIVEAVKRDFDLPKVGSFRTTHKD